LIYRLFFRAILQRIDPEVAHALASRTLRVATTVPGVRTVLGWLAGSPHRRLRVHALGLAFPSPLGVAAGVDKDGSWFDGLGALGFGFVEVGTITALPQAGNNRPRVFRLTQDRALLNRMGFPNPGAHAVAERLRTRGGPVIVGVNVGKSMAAPVQSAGDDYRSAIRQFAPYADYIVVNVSSPNTPGLRDMQDVKPLRALLGEVRGELAAAGTEVPLLVKIGPDLSDDQLDAIAQLATDLELDGIVAVNTTVDRSGLVASADAATSIEGGGVSGAPLKARALEVLRRLHARAGDSFVLISVGGIETPEDAWERILAGATLVQAYTGFVYGGPAWPARMNRALARRVRESGKSSIQELVGAGSPRSESGSGNSAAAPAGAVSSPPSQAGARAPTRSATASASSREPKESSTR
jgi:dihydroorotate dehydrogenase